MSIIISHDICYNFQGSEPVPSPPTTVPLTKKDLMTVYKEVQDARSQWYFFGLALEIDSDNLDSVESLCRGDVKKSLLEVLKIFLKRAEPKPTWQQLADALDSPGVDCGATAEQLRKTHPL